MSDKSDRNKLLIIAFLFIATITACREPNTKESTKFRAVRPQNQQLVNTEIICPNNFTVLIKFALVEDVKNAIVAFYEEKKKNNGKETYTVIKLPDRRSFKIEKVAPEQMIECSLIERRYGEVEPEYIHHF